MHLQEMERATNGNRVGINLLDFVYYLICVNTPKKYAELANFCESIMLTQKVLNYKINHISCLTRLIFLDIENLIVT